MAAEIKVNRTKNNRNKSSEQRGVSGNAGGNAAKKSSATATGQTANSPARPQYDTREEDGQTLNANQKKFYNQQFQFFTKTLGPGHYEPSLELTKPKSQGTGWAANRTNRRELGGTNGRPPLN